MLPAIKCLHILKYFLYPFVKQLTCINNHSLYLQAKRLQQGLKSVISSHNKRLPNNFYPNALVNPIRTLTPVLWAVKALLDLWLVSFIIIRPGLVVLALAVVSQADLSGFTYRVRWKLVRLAYKFGSCSFIHCRLDVHKRQKEPVLLVAADGSGRVSSGRLLKTGRWFYFLGLLLVLLKLGAFVDLPALQRVVQAVVLQHRGDFLEVWLVVKNSQLVMA